MPVTSLFLMKRRQGYIYAVPCISPVSADVSRRDPLGNGDDVQNTHENHQPCVSARCMAGCARFPALSKH